MTSFWEACFFVLFFINRFIDSYQAYIYTLDNYKILKIFHFHDTRYIKISTIWYFAIFGIFHDFSIPLCSIHDQVMINANFQHFEPSLLNSHFVSYEMLEIGINHHLAMNATQWNHPPGVEVA
jgi:hypothetical protein